MSSKCKWRIQAERVNLTWLLFCRGFFDLLSLFLANSFVNTEQEKNYQHLLISMKLLSRLESNELLQYKLSQIWRKK